MSKEGTRSCEQSHITVERARSLSDAQYAFDLAAKQGWSPGCDEAECFYSFCPESIFIAKMNGSNVGCLVLMAYNPRQAHVRLFVVDELYRGKGCGSQTLHAAMDSFKDCNVSVKALDSSVPVYQRMGFNPTWKGKRYRFKAANVLARKLSKLLITLPPDVHFKPLSEVDLYSLTSYDESVFGEPRHECVKKWTSLPNTHGWAALDSKANILGYIATQKPRIDTELLTSPPGYKVRPLYADSLLLARHLLKIMAEFLNSHESSPNSSVLIDAPTEANPQAEIMCKELEGEVDHSFVRMYTKEPQQDFQRSFGSFL